jgi:hypothetical protein
MPYKDPEKEKEYRRNRYATNPAVKLQKRKYRRDHSKHFNACARKETFALKNEVLTYYGPNHVLQCTFCDVIDIDMLTLDHVNNDGCADRRGKPYFAGIQFYRKLRQEGFPPGYQTLCANHQLKKEILRRRNIQ